MKKLKLYLETSIWNYYFADDAPESKAVTRALFKEIEDDVFEIYVSETVYQEINRAGKAKKDQLFTLIEKYSPIELENAAERVALALEYIDKAALPAGSYEDALHASIATIYELDALISWNMRHLVNLN